MSRGSASNFLNAAPQQRARPKQACPRVGMAKLKARQSVKIRELREALVATGFTALDEQANALGLSRSTAWTILNGIHKSSGLSAGIINRMLLAPRLPSLARTKILEYIEERAAGYYGHSDVQLRKFTKSLLIEHLSGHAGLQRDERVSDATKTSRGSQIQYDVSEPTPSASKRD